MSKVRLAILFAIAFLSTSPRAAVAAALEGQLELSAIDRDTGKPIAVRVHLLNTATKKPITPPGVPAIGDHFVFYDKIQLKLPLGSYQFIMERGPEYNTRTGHFTINHYADDRKTVDMKRFVDMADEGWYAGDLDVRRYEREIELLMQAEDLYVASLVRSTNDKNDVAKKLPPANSVQAREPMKFDGRRFYSAFAAEDARGGNALLLLNLAKPLKLQPQDAAHEQSSLAIAAAARQEGAWLDGRPFSWDLPLWVAAGNLDSVQVANRHLLRDGVVNNEAGGRTRDAALYPGIQGNGRWSLDIYYHLLNCGLRPTPTAGSGSGWLPATTAAPGTSAALKAGASGNSNPVGYNRVYVFVEGEFTWDKWWEGLRAGRAVVTNGPLIRPTVEGRPPGYVFQADRGQVVELEIGLSLSTRDKVSYLEIIKNGATEHSVRLADWKESRGKLPVLKFTESGWFLVRAVTDEVNTYRYAMTAPYYVEIGYEPRISRASAQFFVDWCRQRMAQREELLNEWRQADDYWTGLLKRANSP